MHGPRAVRDASSQYLPYHFDYDLDLSDHITIVDVGDAPAVPGSAAKTFAASERDLAEIFEAGAMPIIIGGDHSVTIPGTAALGRALEGPLGFVLFDTHMDTAMDLGGEKLSHCAPVTRTVELEQFSLSNTVLIGMNGPANPREERTWIQEQGVRMYTLKEVVGRGIQEVMREAMNIAWKDANGVYVSVDIDCLDGAYVPGTCAPEPGALTARELLQAMEIVGEVGYIAFDVVEVAPQYDPGGITARMACRVILDLLAARANVLRKKGKK
jgi:agmatinase